MRVRLNLVLALAVLLAAGCLERQSQAPADIGEEATKPPATATAKPLIPTAAPTAASPTLPTPAPGGLYPAPAAEVDIVNADDRTASTLRPALVEAEIAGWHIESIHQLVAQVGDDGRRRILSMDPAPSPMSEELSDPWRSGIHELFFTWPATASYLSDGENGEYVLLGDAEGSDGLQEVEGHFRPAGTDEPIPGTLLIDPRTRRSVGLIASSNTEPLSPVAGDVFAPGIRFWNADDRIAVESGNDLVFNEDGRLDLEARPVQAGTYLLGYWVDLKSGNSVASAEGYQVSEARDPGGYAAYFDAYQGFQFAYPADWQASMPGGNRTTISDPSGSTMIVVTVHPDSVGQSPDDLKAMALSSFGEVSTLYSDLVQVGSIGGVRTAYAYDSDDGPHTGIFLAFVRDGTGYIVDLDGRSEDEEQSLSLAGNLRESWLFRPGIVGQQAGRWIQTHLADLTVQMPSAFRLTTLENGWWRFSPVAAPGFLALRLEDSSEQGLSEIVQHWLQVAGTGVEKFEFSGSYMLSLNATEWQRADFEYERDGGDLSKGYVMGLELGDRVILAWAEAPAHDFESLEAGVFLLTLANVGGSQGM